MDIANKLAGLIVTCIGLGILCIDYVIFTAIGALFESIAVTFGLTGMAVLGIQIIGWIFVLGVMVLFLIVGGAITIFGLSIFFE